MRFVEGVERLHGGGAVVGAFLVRRGGGGGFVGLFIQRAVPGAAPVELEEFAVERRVEPGFHAGRIADVGPFGGEDDRRLLGQIGRVRRRAAKRIRIGVEAPVVVANDLFLPQLRIFRGDRSRGGGRVWQGGEGH